MLSYYYFPPINAHVKSVEVGSFDHSVDLLVFCRYYRCRASPIGSGSVGWLDAGFALTLYVS